MAQKAAAGNLLSFKLESFSEGGALPDGRYLLKDHSVVTWDYEGKGQPTTALRISMVPISVDAKGKITETGEAKIQHYSFGDPNKIGPNKEGTGIVGLTATALSKSCNGYIYLENLVNAGFPSDDFDNDFTVFNGLGVDIVNIAQPKRIGLPASNLVQAGPPQPERERTIPVVKVIGKMPSETKWGAGGGGGAVAGKPAAAPAKAAAANRAASNGNGDAAGVLTEKLLEVLAGEASVERTQTRIAVFKTLGSMDADSKKGVMALFNDDEKLGEVLLAVGDGYQINGPNIEAI